MLGHLLVLAQVILLQAPSSFSVGGCPDLGLFVFFLLNFCFSYAPALKKQMFEVVCMM